MAETDPTLRRPEIDSFFLADAAEAINGKLYVMGGGFDTMIAPAGFPHQVRVSLAAILRVPWDHTNRRLPLKAYIETTDGEEVAGILEGEAEAGRPAGVARGGDVVMAFAGPVQFEADQPLDMVVRLEFAGDMRELPVRLIEPPFPTSPRPH